MNITKEMMDEKLLEIVDLEKKYGECAASKVMKKFCTDEKYRENARDFDKANIYTINHLN